jgi:hypothetical protein
MKKIVIIFSIIHLLIFSTSLVTAATDTGEFILDIPAICKLSIEDADQIISLVQDVNGEAAYETGYVDGDPNKPILIVDANTNWKLSVAVTYDWDIVGSYQKDTGDLQLKVTSSAGHQVGFNNYAGLSLIDQDIASNIAGASNETYNCNYRILLDWKKDIPGVYIIILTYTLSTQPG